MTDTINTTSAYNTPQAVDDFYRLIEHMLEEFGYSNSLDVMSNDLGGKAKTLYAIDNGDLLSDLFQADAQVTFELSALGARISIQNGKIIYDATAIASTINALGEGETLTDTLTYAIRLGNGTLSLGEVKIAIEGTNDAAIITGDIAGTITEDNASASITGNLDSDDVDGPDDSFVAVLVPTLSSAGYGSFTIDASGNWTFALDNANLAVQALEAGETLTDSFSVTTSDGTSQIVTITINGRAEAPTLPPVFNGPDANDHDTDVGTDPNIDVNDFANFIFGTAGSDTINAYGGDDTISGGSGPDFIYAGSGDDTVNGNVGLDALYGQSGDDILNGNQNIDTVFGGSGHDSIDGGDGNDIIYGGSGNDIITGGGGGDTIYGGFGADVLTGGGNPFLNDRFSYLDLRDTGDQITDFTVGYDLIDFSALDANDALAGDQAFAFGGTTATAHGVWYAANGTGGIDVFVDTDGLLNTVELVITIDNLATIADTSFVL